MGKETKSKFVVTGGRPFTGYNGTMTFTSIYTLGVFDTEEESNKCIEDEYDNCGGLIHVQEVTFD